MSQQPVGSQGSETQVGHDSFFTTLQKVLPYKRKTVLLNVYAEVVFIFAKNAGVFKQEHMLPLPPSSPHSK